MERVLDVYGIGDETEIYPYRANIYDLFRILSEEYDSFDDVDLPLILRKREKEYSERWLQLSKRFSDIILVFDFDPQDHLFSTETIERMVSFFDESTIQGKLYVNYPMVEAYRDLSSLPYDTTYMDRSVDMRLLRNKQYKDVVGARSRIYANRRVQCVDFQPDAHSEYREGSSYGRTRL
jgi:hypothetical protein